MDGMKHLVRAALPPPVYTAIKHLSVDLVVPVNQLLVEGALLLLRYHDRGAGLPEPMPPAGRAKKGGGR